MEVVVPWDARIALIKPHYPKSGLLKNEIGDQPGTRGSRWLVGISMQ
jgi:hypothetical protein